MKPRPNFHTKLALPDLIRWLVDLEAGQWSWTANGICKYVEIGIDTRAGVYFIKDRDGKDVENRDWPTKGRGWFIIHAGVSKSELDRDDGRHQLMPRGGIVGMARIVDCVKTMDSKWFYGSYGFVLADAFAVDLISCKGQLGFFMPPQDALSALAAALRAGETK